MEAKLIKIDRNGSKHYEGVVKCDRCGGDGLYKWGAVINGCPQYVGTCFKCEGAGKVIDHWIERTPEYQAKLDARRKAKWDARRAEQEKYIAAEQARREAEEAAERARREAEEAAERARKAISQHAGQIGDKIEFKGMYVRTGSWEQKSFRGFGTDTMYAHTFKDVNGNVFVWKTQNGINLEYGQNVDVRGTVKKHSEYDGEKQTELTRCKITVA